MTRGVGTTPRWQRRAVERARRSRRRGPHPESCQSGRSGTLGRRVGAPPLKGSNPLLSACGRDMFPCCGRARPQRHHPPLMALDVTGGQNPHRMGGPRATAGAAREPTTAPGPQDDHGLPWGRLEPHEEGCQSGRMGPLRKRCGVTPTGVRTPHPPQRPVAGTPAPGGHRAPGGRWRPAPWRGMGGGCAHTDHPLRPGAGWEAGVRRRSAPPANGAPSCRRRNRHDRTRPQGPGPDGTAPPQGGPRRTPPGARCPAPRPHRLAAGHRPLKPTTRVRIPLGVPNRRRRSLWRVNQPSGWPRLLTGGAGRPAGDRDLLPPPHRPRRREPVFSHSAQATATAAAEATSRPGHTLGHASRSGSWVK